jgi:hypothetical protein
MVKIPQPIWAIRDQPDLAIAVKTLHRLSKDYAEITVMHSRDSNRASKSQKPIAKSQEPRAKSQELSFYEPRAIKTS